MRLPILTCFILILIAQQAISQVNIKGRVYDSTDSLELPAVKVINTNSLDSTYTDINGKFSINVDIGDKLEFKFLGYYEIVKNIEQQNEIVIYLDPMELHDSFFTNHDYGWNRLYIGPNFDFTNRLIGGEIEYLSNPLIGYYFYLNPYLNFYSSNEAEVRKASLKILSFIPRNNRLDASLSFKYRFVKFTNYDFENFTLSVLPRIRGFQFDIGLSTSRYSTELNENKYLGFLIGFQEEIKLAGIYFPVEFNSVFWEDDTEFNFRITHRITRWLRTGISYEHYREFNQLAFNLSYSFRLDPRVRNEY